MHGLFLDARKLRLFAVSLTAGFARSWPHAVPARQATLKDTGVLCGVTILTFPLAFRCVSGPPGFRAVCWWSHRSDRSIPLSPFGPCFTRRRKVKACRATMMMRRVNMMRGFFLLLWHSHKTLFMNCFFPPICCWCLNDRRALAEGIKNRQHAFLSLHSSLYSNAKHCARNNRVYFDRQHRKKDVSQGSGRSYTDQ